MVRRVKGAGMARTLVMIGAALLAGGVVPHRVV